MLTNFLLGSKRNQRLLWPIGAILLVIQLSIVVYLADFITPSDYPAWWQAVVDWGLQQIPAAQGWTNRTIAHREEMPAIYMVWFGFSVLTTILTMLLLKNSSLPPSSFVDISFSRGVRDTFVQCCAFVGMFSFVYLWSQDEPITEPRVRIAGLIEHTPGLLYLTFVFFLGGGAVASPLIFFRQKIGRALKNDMVKKEKYDD